MTTSRKGAVGLLTCLALIAFAANSLLARAALLRESIDPASFSTIRIASGALILWMIARARAQGDPRGQVQREHHPPHMGGSWPSAFMLCLYAVPFSFAYVQLSTGTGALILFGFVQLTMIMGAIRSGERPGARQWWGLSIASGGLTYLLLPGLTAPPMGSAALMATAGVGWGLYSLRGRGTRAPLVMTAGNFGRAVPIAAGVSLLAYAAVHVEGEGVLLAVASGGIASGLGYTVWYAALPDLTSTTAGIVQLAVPVVAALLGVIILSEEVDSRLVLSGTLVLGGIALATLHRRDPNRLRRESIREYSGGTPVDPRPGGTS